MPFKFATGLPTKLIVRFTRKFVEVWNKRSFRGQFVFQIGSFFASVAGPLAFGPGLVVANPGFVRASRS